MEVSTRILCSVKTSAGPGEWVNRDSPATKVDSETAESLEAITINYEHPETICLKGVWYQRQLAAPSSAEVG